MTIEDISKICKGLRGTTTDIKWEDHLCFNVGDKMFLITSPDSVPVTASLKVCDDDFVELIQREGIIPAPYLARYKWIFLDDIDRLSPKEWTHYAREAHRLIAEKLPLKTKKALGIS